MTTLLPIAIFVVGLGPFVGSFIGVLVDRLPQQEDVVLTRSSCRKCGRTLLWRDLVPILSFAVQRGRCRICNAAIPPHLLLLEIAGLGLALLAVFAGGTGAHVVLTAAMLWLLLALFACDLAMFRLPDALNGLLFVVALWRAPDALWALQGAALGVGAFALIRWIYAYVRKREGLGLGDVKLMAGLGALVGPLGLAQLLLLAALLGLAAAGGQALRKGHVLSGATPLPFGSALCAAAFGMWILGFA